MDYATVKMIHIGCAALSYAGFFARGMLMIRSAPLLHARWMRVVPHVVDTLLLASAIVLAAMSHQYPFVEPWLTAKVIALVLYIGIGMIALRRGRTRRGRTVAWVAAQLVFVYIVAVAITHSPWPWVT